MVVILATITLGSTIFSFLYVTDLILSHMVT